MPLVVAACSPGQQAGLMEEPLMIEAVGTAGQQNRQGETGVIALRAVMDVTTRTGTNVQTSAFVAGREVTVILENYLEEDEESGNDVLKAGPTANTCTVGTDQTTLMLPNTTGLLQYPGTGDLYAKAVTPKPTGNRFTVAADQREESDYLASDLVLSERRAYSQKTGVLELPFKHLMAKIVVKLTPANDSGITTDDIAAAKVEIQAWRTCSFNISSQTSILPTDIVYTARELVRLSPNGACIIPPQVYQPGERFIIITPAGGSRKIITIPTPNGKTFEGGKEYVYDINVNSGWELS